MIFVDPSAFLAIENRLDAHHSRALSLRNAWLKKGQNLVTSDYVLDESYTIIRLRAGHPVVVQFGETIWNSQLLRTIYVTPEIIEESFFPFRKRGNSPLWNRGVRKDFGASRSDDAELSTLVFPDPATLLGNRCGRLWVP
ncbi:MAG: PilT protein domain protein [Deltaproteobacteria bacterium]|nr:PilT protein domain protein [Deltaproteobacteria bacterium]